MGHSTYQHAFEFAAQVSAKRLVPFHHDPSHDDDMLDRLLEGSTLRFRSRCSVAAGREGRGIQHLNLLLLTLPDTGPEFACGGKPHAISLSWSA
jgi:hypothetical protein